MIYAVLFSPLELVFDWVFSFVQNVFPGFGVVGAIFGLSVFVSVVTIPLYSVADRITQNERQTVKRMEKWVRHIKKTFRGDERFMMLSELYRQNGYHPLFALKSTLPILIQLPFFIAAYRYLRTNDLLSGASFLFLKDLSMPDALIPFPSNIVLPKELPSAVNVLPFLMTFINLLSGFLYSHDYGAREKVQAFFLPAVFLVLLYNSPSGLVVYWTLNNVFSLLKNAFKKSSGKMRFLLFAFLILAHVFALRSSFVGGFCILAVAWTIVLLPVFLRLFPKSSFALVIFSYKKEFSPILAVFLQLNKKIQEKYSSFFSKNSFDFKKNLPLLFFSGLALSVLCGLVLPSSVISSSPIEFSFLGDTPSPVSYIASSFCIFAGFFVVYPLALYALFGRLRTILPTLLFAFFICAIFNVYVFHPDYGNLDVSFNLSDIAVLQNIPPYFVLLPLEIFVVGVGVVIFFALRKKVALIDVALFAVGIGMIGIGIKNIKTIQESYEEYAANLEKYGSKGFLEGDVEKVYHFSKTKKNVLVLFLDRGIGPFVGDIFDNYPEIKKQFDGFTWYPNTVSFSVSTVTGAPPLYGGYEYNQENMNAREIDKLRIKNTESQLVLPKLFIDAGWSATMTDPIWPGYRWSGFLNDYSRLPELSVSELEGKNYKRFVSEKGLLDYDDADEVCKKQIVNFSFLQMLTPNLRDGFYQKMRLFPKRKGIADGARGWLWRFSHLYYLPELTDFDCDSEKGAFINIHSLAAHDVYTPADDFETPAEEPLSDGTEIHHLADIAAFKQFGKFFDFLKENDCYDNTRIIIVSDHGCVGSNEKQWERFAKGNFASGYSAMLLLKDFGSSGEVCVDDTFMTNADTIFLAKAGLDLSDINPYTEQKLVQQKEDGVNVYWCVDWNAGNFIEATQFELDENNAWHVSKNIYDEKNWIPLKEWKKQNGGEE